jgi:phosphatidylinositol alpha-1,6-mannosyltransferase
MQYSDLPQRLRTFERSTSQPATLLGLFPWLGPGSIGGVQVSGQLAWEGLAPAAERHGGRALRLSYGAPRRAASAADTLPAASRGQAIRAMLGRRWNAEVALFWHVDLLKLLPLLLLRGARPRVVLFLHGIEVWRRPSRLTRMLLRRVDLFLCNSEHTWGRACGFAPAIAIRPHQVVHLGIGEALPTPPPAPSGPPAALMLGRLARSEDYKGHRELIAAWPRVLAQVPTAELWIAGDGDLRAELQHAAWQHGVERAVRFWGQVSEAQKQTLLERCRCFAMPSRAEGFGLVYLEAMRLGRPCLVGDADAGREVVAPPEAGLAADPYDQDSLSSAVARLLAPGPEWQGWSEAARRRYEARFTARQFQGRLIAALGICEGSALALP